MPPKSAKKAGSKAPAKAASAINKGPAAAGGPGAPPAESGSKLGPIIGVVVVIVIIGGVAMMMGGKKKEDGDAETGGEEAGEGAGAEAGAEEGSEGGGEPAAGGDEGGADAKPPGDGLVDPTDPKDTKEASLTGTTGEAETAGPRPDIFKDCHQMLTYDPQTKSGVYEVQPTDTTKKKVKCDMTSGGGGWTIIQHRTKDSETFYKKYAEYEEGFGSPDKSYWAGLKFIHALTFNSKNSLMVKFTTATDKTEKKAMYVFFKIESESNKYKMTLSHYVRKFSSATDELKNNNGMKFTTNDQDNDKKLNMNCGSFNRGRGGFWYSDCGTVNINGDFKYKDTRGVQWAKTLLSSTTMMVRQRPCNSNPCKHLGICLNDNFEFLCKCQRGYVGKRCGDMIDECASKPCVKGQTCTDKLDGYVCTCPPNIQIKTCNGPLKNVALKRPANHSSTYKTAKAYLAVDGNDEANQNKYSKCSQTMSRLKQWFMVELFAEYLICAIKIRGRSDCCTEALVHFDIRVGNDKVASKNPNCAYQEDELPKGSFKELKCDSEIKGKVVSVHATSAVTRQMSICELQIMAPVC